jgi:hypothetical protein
MSKQRLIHVNRDRFSLHKSLFLFKDEPRILSSPNKTHLASISNSDSERTSEVNSGSQNRYTGTSSDGSSTAESHSPVLLPSLNLINDHLIDSGKGSSLLTGTSFDVLMNSLKSMRDKDLDFVIHQRDDSLIGIVD